MSSLHILAVFGAEVAHAPTGLERQPSIHSRFPEPETFAKHDAECQQILQDAYGRSKPQTRSLALLGKGCGFSFESSPYVSYASRDGVHVMLAGEVSRWPGVDAVSTSHDAFVRNEPLPESNDASWLLDFYATFTDEGVEEDLELQPPPAGAPAAARKWGGGTAPAVLLKALQCLAELEGAFSFVIFDSVRHRVLAARDREGVSPLFWGTTAQGQLLIGSSLSDMTATDPTATAFPAGCLFTSEHVVLACCPGDQGWLIPGDDTPGEVTSFIEAEDHEHFKGVKSIPRITSKGVLCGSVYKVASTAEMSLPCHAV